MQRKQHKWWILNQERNLCVGRQRLWTDQYTDIHNKILCMNNRKYTPRAFNFFIIQEWNAEYILQVMRSRYNTGNHITSLIPILKVKCRWQNYYWHIIRSLQFSLIVIISFFLFFVNYIWTFLERLNSTVSQMSPLQRWDDNVRQYLYWQFSSIWQFAHCVILPITGHKTQVTGLALWASVWFQAGRLFSGAFLLFRHWL